MSRLDDNARGISSNKKKIRKNKNSLHNISTSKRLKVMRLENSFCTSESEQSDDNEKISGNETISPQKPRKVRMLERSANPWNRYFKDRSTKVLVKVQLAEVQEVVELSTYLSNMGEEGESLNPMNSCLMESTSKEPFFSDTNDKKYRRIKLFDDSSSSSETEVDKCSDDYSKYQAVDEIPIKRTECDKDVEEASNKSSKYFDRPRNSANCQSKYLTQNERGDRHSTDNNQKRSSRDESQSKRSKERPHLISKLKK